MDSVLLDQLSKDEEPSLYGEKEWASLDDLHELLHVVGVAVVGVLVVAWVSRRVPSKMLMEGSSKTEVFSKLVLNILL